MHSTYRQPAEPATSSTVWLSRIMAFVIWMQTYQKKRKTPVGLEPTASEYLISYQLIVCINDFRE